MLRYVSSILVLLLTLTLLVSCTESPPDNKLPDDPEEYAPPYKESSEQAPMTSDGEVRPTLYYREQMYELRHWDGNKIDVTDMSLDNIGIMNYAGGKLLADLDTTEPGSAGESVYIDPAQPERLIYQCHICKEYYSITTEYDPSDHPEKTACEPKEPPDDGLPAPGVYYRGAWHSLIGRAEEIDITGRELEYVGVFRATGLVYRKAELDIMSAQELAGSSAYIDPEQPDILIYHDENADEYFSIDLK